MTQRCCEGLLSLSALFTCKKALSQPYRIRQRDEMTAGNFHHLLSEPFTRDTALEFDWEKAIVSSRQNVNGDVGPVIEAAGLAEDGLGLLAWLLRSGTQHVPRHIVQEVRRRIKFGRVAMARRILFSRFGRPRCAPPCASHLAGLRDHRIDEHDHPQGRTLANKWHRETR